MIRLWSKLIRLVVRCLARSHPSLPLELERELKRLQGKGVGGTTVDLEASISINFLQQFAIKSPIVLDVGANVGEYSEALLAICPQAKIFAFEPSQHTRSKLVQKFNTDTRVTIFPYALSSTNSKQYLWSNTLGSGLASLTRRKLTHFGIDFNIAEEIEVITLDHWAKKLNLRPDMLKIDVEGHELDVLKGSTETLQHLKVIQFEFGGCNIDTRTFFQDFWYLLKDLNFDVYRISKYGPIHIASYSEDDECFVTSNFVAVKVTSKSESA